MGLKLSSIAGALHCLTTLLLLLLALVVGASATCILKPTGTVLLLLGWVMGVVGGVSGRSVVYLPLLLVLLLGVAKGGLPRETLRLSRRPVGCGLRPNPLSPSLPRERQRTFSKVIAPWPHARCRCVVLPCASAPGGAEGADRAARYLGRGRHGVK